MKSIIKYFAITVILVFAIGNIAAQTDNTEQLIKDSLTKLFELSKAEKFDEAANLIVYSGDEIERKYKDTYKIADRNEAKQVKRICKKIKALLDITDNYVMEKISAEKDDGINLSVLTVNFNSSGQKLSTKFEYVKVGEKFLLLNVK